MPGLWPEDGAGGSGGKFLADPRRRFLFDLALALGRTVRELEASIGEDELREWMAYAGIRPFGETADYWRAGVIASTIANVNRDPKKSKPFEPAQFMPRDPKPAPAPADAKRAAARRLRAQFFEAFGDRLKPGARPESREADDG